MPLGPVSCIGGTKYPHCILLYCIVLSINNGVHEDFGIIDNVVDGIVNCLGQ